MSRRRRDVGRLAAVAVATVALGLAIGGRWTANVWLTTGVAGAVAIAAALAADRREIVARLARPLRGVALGAASGVAMVIATHLLFRFAADLLPGLAMATGELYRDLADPPGPRRAAPILALVVLGEELVWRAVLPALLAARGVAAGRAVLPVTLLYALPQAASGSLLLAAVALAAGAVWTLLGVLRRDLWAPLVCHLTWSLSLFVFWPLPVR